MGVIIKQSFWSTFIAYLGVVIGYLNTLYLRPEFFELDQIGLFQLITANAMMISPLSSMGMGSSFIKFFPSFKDSEKNQFFTFLFSITLLGNALVLLIGYSLQDLIALRYQETAPEYVHYLSITAIIILVNSLFDLFFSYSRTIMKVVFPSFLRDVFLRVAAILLVVGFALEWFSFDWAVRGLAVNYSLAFLLLFLQLVTVQKFRFNFNFSIVSKDWRRKLIHFALYSMLLAGSFAVINNSTYDQVTAHLGAAANGIFTTCFFIGVIVEMPRRNMAKVIAPIISTSFENKKFEDIKELYKRGSITMSVIGSLLFIGILTNINDLFLIIPKGNEFKMGLGVVLGVCIAKLFLMASSFPGEIINFSKLYRYNLIFQIAAAMLLIILNNSLIKILGLNGAAISYTTVILVHTIAKLVFIKYHFNMHPFAKQHLGLLMISILVFVCFYFFKISPNPTINIITRSILTTLVFLLLIYRFKISDDINKLIHSTFDSIRKTNSK